MNVESALRGHRSAKATMSGAVALMANATRLTTDMTDSSIVAEGFALVSQRYATLRLRGQKGVIPVAAHA